MVMSFYDAGICLGLLSTADFTWLLRSYELPSQRSERVPRSGEEVFGAEVTVGSLISAMGLRVSYAGTAA